MSAALVRNPPLGRIRYIADRYPAWVVLDTFYVLSDTIGVERPGDVVDRPSVDLDQNRRASPYLALRRWG